MGKKHPKNQFQIDFKSKRMEKLKNFWKTNRRLSSYGGGGIKNTSSGQKSINHKIKTFIILFIKRHH